MTKNKFQYFIILFSLTFCGTVLPQILDKETVRDYLINKKFLKDANSVFTIEQSTNKKFKDFDVYIVNGQEIPRPRRGVLLSQNGNFFLMPMDFNRVLLHAGEKVVQSNELRIAQDFINLILLDETVVETIVKEKMKIGDT